MKNEQTVSIYLWMLLVPIFWGGAFVAAEHIIEEIPPITAAAFRFGVAGIILWFILKLQGSINYAAVKKRILPIIGMALTGIVGYNVFFFIGLDLTSAINGSLIIATTPVLVTVGAVILFGESWNKQIGLGLLLSFVGVSIVISKGSLDSLFNLQLNMGDFLFLGALCCWVIHGLLGKVVMNDVGPLMTTTMTMIIGGFILILISFFEGGWGNIGTMSLQAWLEMAFMIVCSSVIGFILWNNGIKRIGASQSSIYMNLVPISTALLSVFLYGASITIHQIIGMIMVLTGVYVVTVHQSIRNKRLMSIMKDVS